VLKEFLQGGICMAKKSPIKPLGFRVLLKEFEEDLHMHIHLENNMLFPRAIEMEKSFHEKV